MTLGVVSAINRTSERAYERGKDLLNAFLINTVIILIFMGMKD